MVKAQSLASYVILGSHLTFGSFSAHANKMKVFNWEMTFSAPELRNSLINLSCFLQ